ncbi:FG-GAP-like repeat-containing protein, partial [Porticoccus sp. W117]|uniref:FG-GAP-like repeat-containing protein n=1 Tax=Porticoccus sp. W117 TaxID=3054777 RepID=UPI002597BE5B
IMMGIKRAIGLGLLATTFFAGSASAVEFGSNDYEVYSGNLNNDGCEDIYLKAKERVILITVDITTPILIPPAGSSYKILSSVVDNQCTYPDANVLVDETIDVTSLTAGAYQYVSGDFNNDGFQDVRLVPASSSNSALTLAGGSTPSFIGEFVAAAPSVHVEPTPSASSAEVLETDSVGTTAGSFRVDESGSATYSIPIATAEGTAGVAPQLSLNYNSGGGNGVAGLGWNIGGLSGISRSRQTLQQDGVAKPISWGANDRFALDGQRLILVSGIYGDPDSEYRTEIDSFAKITAKGGTTGHPDYWEVKRKDGSISTYGWGGSSDSEQQPYNANGTTSGYVLTWALKEFRDVADNRIVYSYHNDLDGHRLDKAQYAYGDANSHSFYNAHVLFEYETRTDPINGYVVGGYRTYQTQRLNRIRSYNGSTELRRYNLTYRAQPSFTTESGASVDADQISRLESSQECVGNHCLPATQFDWSVPVLPHISDTAVAGANGSASNSTRQVVQRVGDVNGDGRDDIVWTERDSSENLWLYYALSNGSTQIPATFSDNSSAYYVGDRIVTTTQIPYGSSTTTRPPNTELTLLDYNADGVQDVLITSESGNRVLLSTPSSAGVWSLSATAVPEFSGIGLRVSQADLDSDGLGDIVFREYGTGLPKAHKLKRNPAKTDNSSAAYHFDASSVAYGDTDGWLYMYNQGADFNGDGRNDLVVAEEKIRGSFGSTSTCAEYNDAGYCEILRETAPLKVFVRTEGDYQLYANVDYRIDHWLDALSNITHSLESASGIDINGDGLSDLVLQGSLNVDLYSPEDLAVNPNAPPYASYTYTSVQVFINRGNGVFDRLAEGYAMSGANPYGPLIDMNRDGFMDLVVLGEQKSLTSHAVVVRFWNPSTETFDDGVEFGLDGDWESGYGHLFADINGDGAPDIRKKNLQAVGNSDDRWEYYLSTNGAINLLANKITQITNGLGAETNITYQTLSTSGHYEKPRVSNAGGEYNHSSVASFYTALNQDWQTDAGADGIGRRLIDTDGDGDVDSNDMLAPVLPLNGQIPVVTSVDQSAPIATDANNVHTTEYYYADAKLQAMGRGFLGFGRMRQVDATTGVQNTTWYRQDFPFQGHPKKVEVRSKEGHLLSETENTWKLKVWDWNNPGSVGSLGHTGHLTDWSSVAGTSSGKYQQLTLFNNGQGIFRPYLAQSVQRTYDLVDNASGATTTQGSLLKTVTTETTEDGYGNPLTQIATTVDNTTGLNTSGHQYKVTTTNVYD